MPNATVIIRNTLGLHARASAKLVRLAQTFDATIDLQRVDDDEKANARDILELLQLAASRGTEIRVSTNGQDAAIALNAVIELIETGFGEEPAALDRDMA